MSSSSCLSAPSVAATVSADERMACSSHDDPYGGARLKEFSCGLNAQARRIGLGTYTPLTSTPTVQSPAGWVVLATECVAGRVE